ncbi:bifunctional DNA primase/polymerase [Geothrix sp.]|uniref:bifunctional DNA primase/polymerase n=1 Tax=Geothrix sp. TaxID=1962974 RepID=UPI00344C70D1
MKGFDRSTVSSLEGIASYGCVFLELQPGKKMPTRAWDDFLYLHDQQGQSRLDLAFAWLKRGNGVGYLFRNRLAAVDCDSPETVQRVIRFNQERGIKCPITWTPSGGRHFLFELPQSVDQHRLKHHVCHPKEAGVVMPWDFKLGSRTMLVAPGTIRFDADGNEIGRYKASPWMQPPVVDPRDLAPGLSIYPEFPADLLERLLRELGAVRLPVLCGEHPLT